MKEKLEYEQDSSRNVSGSERELNKIIKKVNN